MTIGELARLFNDAFASAPGSTSFRSTAGVGRCTSTRQAFRSLSRRRTCRRSTASSSIRAPCSSRARRLSEGRGTTRPFELIGAPWIDGDRLADAMNAGACPASTSGRRSSSRHSRSTRGSRAAAARFTCSIARRFSPFGRPSSSSMNSGTQDPARFAWREPPYEVRAREAADRHPLRIGSPAPHARREPERVRSSRLMAGDEERFQASGGRPRTCCTRCKVEVL